MKESVFANKIIHALEGVGCWCFNVHGHRFQKLGVPDCYVAHCKWTGWIELKTGSAKPSALQVMNIKDLLIRNVPAFVVRLREEIIYCELWFSDDYETLAYSDCLSRSKGQTLGLDLLRMFDTAGQAAVEIIKNAV